MRYTKEHEWIRPEGENWLIGITDHAQDALGDIVFVELPALGDQLAVGESLAVIESVKAVANAYCPVDAEVVEINAALEDEPQAINERPMEAWIAKVRPADASALDSFMDEVAYTAFLAEEAE